MFRAYILSKLLLHLPGANELKQMLWNLLFASSRANQANNRENNWISALLAICERNHQLPVDFPHKGPVKWKVFYLSAISWHHHVSAIIAYIPCVLLCTNARIILCMCLDNRRRYDHNIISHWLGAFIKWSLLFRTQFQQSYSISSRWSIIWPLLSPCLICILYRERASIRDQP